MSAWDNTDHLSGCPPYTGKAVDAWGAALTGDASGARITLQGGEEEQRALLCPHHAGESPHALQSSEGTQPRLAQACGGPGEQWDPRRGSYLGSFATSSSGQALFPGRAGGTWVPPLSHGPRLA